MTKLKQEQLDFDFSINVAEKENSSRIKNVIFADNVTHLSAFIQSKKRDLNASLYQKIWSSSAWRAM